jgi:putative component of membrane protein insertase Oxa1/YidC/SpoIIIJ protein YidD
MLMLLQVMLSAATPVVSRGSVWSDGEQEWPPWEFTTEDDIATVPGTPDVVGSVEILLDAIVLLHSRTTGPARGARCPMYPSCSAYARRAVQGRCPLVAFILVLDRLQRCGQDLRFYEPLRDMDGPRWYDTVLGSATPVH